MVGQCFQLCIQGISAVFGFFGMCMNLLGAWFYIFGAFLIFTIYRLLLKPLIGAAVNAGASDTVKSMKKKSSGSSKGSSKGSGK